MFNPVKVTHFLILPLGGCTRDPPLGSQRAVPATSEPHFGATAGKACQVIQTWLRKVVWQTGKRSTDAAPCRRFRAERGTRGSWECRSRPLHRPWSKYARLHQDAPDHPPVWWGTSGQCPLTGHLLSCRFGCVTRGDPPIQDARPVPPPPKSAFCCRRRARLGRRGRPIWTVFLDFSCDQDRYQHRGQRRYRGLCAQSCL